MIVEMTPVSSSVAPVHLLQWVVGILGSAVAVTVVYTCLTDGSPFRMQILTP